jgi:CheY-like chemotaxis protein
MTPYANGNYKVLVVDDDPSVLKTYGRLLVRAGYKCSTRDDPIALLEDDSCLAGVHLLLLDYKMPGMDGLSLLAELRRREFRGQCVLISAYLNPEVRQQAKVLGVERILEKPVDIGTFRSTVAEVLPLSGVSAARLGA